MSSNFETIDSKVDSSHTGFVIRQPPLTTPAIRQTTPVPIQSMSKRQIFSEIERVEKQQRDLRRIGQELPLSTADYLEKLKSALDAGT